MISFSNIDNRFSTGLFISNKQQTPYKIFDQNSHIYLTQPDNIAIKLELLRIIDSARSVLKICSFIITDEEVYNHILKKAKENIVAIFILTQLDESKLKNTTAVGGMITEEELSETTAVVHLRSIKTLYDNGVHVRAATTAHAKFIVADRTNGFLMTANLTTPSLNKNTELGIYLNTEDATQLDKLFDVVFLKGTEYRHFVSASRNKNFIVQAEAKVKESDLNHISKTSGLRFTYGSEKHNSLYDEIVKIIVQAENFVYLSSYCIIDLDNLPEFKNAIEAAIKRNVRIHIFCRGMNFRNDHLIACDWLHGIGCVLHGDIYNHSKGIANEKNGLLFTANIDGKHGLKSGFEVGCVLSEDQRSFFISLQKNLIAQSEYSFCNDAVRQEFFDTYLNYQKEKETLAVPFPDSLSITVLNNNIILDDLCNLPIFYAYDSKGKYLLAGDNLFRCSYENGTFEILAKERMNYKLEKCLLTYKTLVIN